MGSKITAMFLIFWIFMLLALPPIHACIPCTQPHPNQPPYHYPKVPHPNPPTTKRPPHHSGKGSGGHGGSGSDSGHGGGSKGRGGTRGVPSHNPPAINPPYTPPVVLPPIITPPVINPPVTTPPPHTGNPPSGGGNIPGLNPPPTSTPPMCPADSLKLGLCVDVLGGLVHVGLGNPVENACCPVLGGLLELEAAVCLCTAIRIKLLNINIFIPLALQALITCGKTPPPGFVCPPL